jgi:hypothetical protein
MSVLVPEKRGEKTVDGLLSVAMVSYFSYTLIVYIRYF